jgi:hypothetical protein
MEELTSGWLGYLSLLWIVLLVLWLSLLGYRAMLASREEDTLFLTKGEEHAAEDQKALAVRLSRLAKPLWAAGISVGVLLLTIVGLWLWHGMTTIPKS